MSTVRDRVEKGAALLDEHVPGWHRLIDLKELDLSSCEDCVCGQIARAAYYGEVRLTTRRPVRGFNSMLSFLGRKMGLSTQAADFQQSKIATEHGFDTFQYHHSYRRLDREWGRVIRARLRAE